MQCYISLMSTSTSSKSPLTSYPKNKIKVLLLENIHKTAVDFFSNQNFQIELLKSALSEAELKEKIQNVHILGIRSKTQITHSVLKEAKSLIGLGCFCIGTNQVDLKNANALGIPVFNAPFSNTRSVAEMVLGEIISLSRQLGDRSQEVHKGAWKKVASGCFEVRGKILGIVGYGHIGQQVSVLAEALGMRVVFFDIAPKLPIGMAQSRDSLKDVLKEADFITLHVPETAATKNMISAAEMKAMKKGSYLINASRGTVIVIEALVEALKSNHIAGAAIDVFPEEPESNEQVFKSPLQGLPNVILTPHIGGSTEEAQANIGKEVAISLTKFMNNGSSTGSVNFPLLEAPDLPGSHRILNVHKNVPGVLKDINKIVSDRNANIRGQMLSTDNEIGYLIMDLDKDVASDVKQAIEDLPTSIRTRILY